MNGRELLVTVQVTKYDEVENNWVHDSARITLLFAGNQIHQLLDFSLPKLINQIEYNMKQRRATKDRERGGKAKNKNNKNKELEN